MPHPPYHDLDFWIDEFDARENFVDRLAAAAHLFVGRAAFDAAVRQHPEKIIVYRHKARLIAKHPPDDEPG